MEYNAVLKKAEKYFQQKDYDNAFNLYKTLLYSEKDQRLFIVYFRLAYIYQLKKLYHKAIEYYKKALKLNPHFTDIYNNLGSVYRSIGKYDKAIECFSKDMDSYPGLFNLGILFEMLGKINEARKCFYRAIKLNPQKSFSLQTKISLLAPAIYKSKNEIIKTRRKIEYFIDNNTDKQGIIENPISDIGTTNFYLGYHGICNKKINKKIADFFYLHLNKNFLFFKETFRKNFYKKIRIGFISAFFSKHSVSDVSNGWIARLDKEKFDIYIFSISDIVDDSVKLLKKNCSKFFSLPQDFIFIKEFLSKQDLDILFFLDIGLEPFTYFLAFSRFAPVQITYAGHPDTTGIKNIDYYISSKYWETNTSNTHYTEKLIKFDSLTWYYHYPKFRLENLKDREFFNFSGKDNIYCINQSLFKIHPDFDYILDKILLNDSNAKIVIFYDENHFWWKNFLIDRFNKNIKHYKKIIFIPKLKFEYYLNFLKISNVILDTLYFNGGTTSLQTFAIGTPIVTLPSDLMRGRFTYGFYKKMDIDELVATSFDDYIDKALEIANDKDKNYYLTSKILSNNKCLYENIEIVKEFEKFFLSLF